MVTFVKYAAEVLMGYHSKRFVYLLTYPLLTFTSPDRHHQLAKLTGKPLFTISLPRLTSLLPQLTSVCDKLSQDLEKSFKDLRSKEKRYEKDKVVHGMSVISPFLPLRLLTSTSPPLPSSV
jgi:hypothetical protein